MLGAAAGATRTGVRSRAAAVRAAAAAAAAGVDLVGPPPGDVGAGAEPRFFDGRIPPEEEFLVKIYKERYIKFCQVTPIGIPFVSGHVSYVGKAAAAKGM